jgi:hypothetical protein
MERHRRRLREARLLNRQKPAREKKSTSKWWSDPPKLIPILISVTAVTISCLSWWESHRGRLINEEVNRPILVLSDVRYTYGSSGVVEKNHLLVTFLVKLKNNGKFTARVHNVNISPGGLTSRIPGCEETKLEELPIIPLEILPGMDSIFLGDISVSPECKDQPIVFFVHTNVQYSDSRPDSKYEQSFTERVEVFLDSEKLN